MMPTPIENVKNYLNNPVKVNNEVSVELINDLIYVALDTLMELAPTSQCCLLINGATETDLQPDIIGSLPGTIKFLFVLNPAGFYKRNADHSATKLNSHEELLADYQLLTNNAHAELSELVNAMKNQLEDFKYASNFVQNLPLVAKLADETPFLQKDPTGFVRCSKNQLNKPVPDVAEYTVTEPAENVRAVKASYSKFFNHLLKTPKLPYKLSWNAVMAVSGVNDIPARKPNGKVIIAGIAIIATLTFTGVLPSLTLLTGVLAAAIAVLTALTAPFALMGAKIKDKCTENSAPAIS